MSSFQAKLRQKKLDRLSGKNETLDDDLENGILTAGDPADTPLVFLHAATNCRRA